MLSNAYKLIIIDASWMSMAIVIQSSFPLLKKKL